MSSAEDRATTLKAYQEYRTALSEAEDLLSQAPDDAETRNYVDEIRDALTGIAESLNATDGIEITERVAVHRVPSAESSDVDGTRTIYTTSSACRYEVHYDNATWYSCIILGVVPPTQSFERQQYKVSILGYPDVEVVPAEDLRLWEAPAEPIVKGCKLHAVDGAAGFRPCTVDRVSPNGTVVVVFDGDLRSAEVPLSHLRCGKVYRALMKKRKDMTDEERKARNAAKKRERLETKKQTMSDLCAQDSSDWQRLLESVNPGTVKVARKEALRPK